MPRISLAARNHTGTPTKGRRRHQRGQAIVELALVVPFLFILLFGIIDFGWALRSYVTVTNATREGARLAIVSCNSATNVTSVKDRVVAYSSGLLTTGDVTVDADPSTTAADDCSSTLPGSGNSIKVKSTYTYNFITPLGGFVESLSGQTLNVTSSSTMRLE
jgi:Flp pilus assembly protein TadG